MTYRIQAFELCQNAGAWKATADICFGGKIVVHGVRIVQYEGATPFVRFPDRKIDAKYKALISICDASFRRKVCNDLLQLYADTTRGYII